MKDEIHETSAQESMKEGRRENATGQEPRNQGDKENTSEESVSQSPAVGMNSSACNNEKSACADSGTPNTAKPNSALRTPNTAKRVTQHTPPHLASPTSLVPRWGEEVASQTPGPAQTPPQANTPKRTPGEAHTPGAAQTPPQANTPMRTPGEAQMPPQANTAQRTPASPFVFLTMMDWSLHKGWDSLLTGFLRAFEGRQDVRLVLKVWSTNYYSNDEILEQARQHVLETLGVDLASDDRVQFVFDTLSRAQLIALYKRCDCYVSATRGEGWGRTFTEAMAMEISVIGTNWSGNRSFMTHDNSYLIDCTVVDIPEAGWREIPAYKGHRWAEPDIEHLQQLMLRVVECPEEAAAKAAIARQQVRALYSRSAVGRVMADELRRGDGEALRREDGKTGGPGEAEGLRQDGGRTGGLGDEPIEDPKSDDLASPSPNLSRLGRGTCSPEAGRLRPQVGAGDTGSQSLPVAPSPSLPVLSVRWEGAFFNWHSLALVNRESCALFEEDPEVELSCVPVEPPDFDPDNTPRFRKLSRRMFAVLTSRPDVHIKHSYPPLMNRPDSNAYVHMIAWEAGFLPREWVKPLRDNTDEIWVYSNYARDVCIASGIPAERVFVIPLGVNTALFHPDAPRYVITDEPGAKRYHALKNRCREDGRGKSGEEDDIFIFMIVGGLFARKGVDLLEEAYCKAFSASDRVVLIAKNTGLNGAYRGSTEGERFRALAEDESRPAVVYIAHDIPESRMPGLYCLADLVFLPYRGEAFCLPAIEAQSCGRAVATTEGGPTDDFVRKNTAWRIKSTRKPCPPGPVGPWDCCGPAWMFEPDVADMVRIMREAYHNRELTRAKGRTAREHVRAGWTWGHTVAKMKERIVALAAGRHASEQEDRKEGGQEEPATKEPTSAQDVRNQGGKEGTEHTSGIRVTIAKRGVMAKRGKRKLLPAVGMNSAARDDVKSACADSGGPDAAEQSKGETPALNEEGLGGVVHPARESGVVPKLKLLSGVEVVDRRSVNATPIALSGSVPPNTQDLRPNTRALAPTGSVPPNTEHRAPNTNSYFRRKRPTIALCMIMRDEERVLDACLKSVKPWFENIYIVDTGSVDSSVDIARSHGAITSHRPWDNSFSNARNASLEMTRGEDYVAWVDCDDELPPECGEGMHRIVASAEDRITGYLMDVHIPPKPGENGYTVVTHLKLFRNDWPSKSNPLRFIGHIHEQILEPINANDGAIEKTNLYIVHAGYDYSDAGQAKKKERDYTILALDESERPFHSFPKFNYGMTYLHNGEFDLGIQKLIECIGLSQPQESTLPKAYAMLAGCYLGKRDFESAREALDTGLALKPHDIELLFRSANFYYDMGDNAAAERFYMRLFNDVRLNAMDSIDISMQTYKGRHNYALALTAMGRFDDAEAQLRIGLASNPGFSPSWHALGDLFVRRRRFDDARGVLQKLEVLDTPLAEVLRVRMAEAMKVSVI